MMIKKLVYVFLVTLVLVATSIQVGFANEYNKEEAEVKNNSSQSVCSFIDALHDGLKNLLTKKEWSDFQNGKTTKSNPIDIADLLPKKIYIYAQKGIEIHYTKHGSNNEKQIWIITLPAVRLPAEMRVKSYFLSRFNVSQDIDDSEVIRMGCDATDLNIYLKGDAVVRIEMNSIGAI